jgi:hypothetical protein
VDIDPGGGGVAPGEPLFALLEAFNVVDLTIPEGADEPAVRADTEAAALFLLSLAEYLDAGLPLLHDWEGGRVVEAPYTDGQVMSGPDFLYIMEKRRNALTDDPPALRQVDVALVLIKARIRRGVIRYLVQFDPEERRYRPPGGPAVESDANIKATAIRHLEGDLPNFRFDWDRDELIKLRPTISVPVLAPRHGVVTTYRYTFLRFDSRRSRLSAEPFARWARRGALLPRAGGQGMQSPTVEALHRLVNQLPGGLGNLDLSIDMVSRSARSRPYE